MLEKKSDLTVEEIREALQMTARPVTMRFTSGRPAIIVPVDGAAATGHNFDAGFGLVDAEAALRAIGP